MCVDLTSVVAPINESQKQPTHLNSSPVVQNSVVKAHVLNFHRQLEEDLSDSDEQDERCGPFSCQ